MAKKQTTERRPFEGIKAGLEDVIAFAQGDRKRGAVIRGTMTAAFTGGSVADQAPAKPAAERVSTEGPRSDGARE